MFISNLYMESPVLATQEVFHYGNSALSVNIKAAIVLVLTLINLNRILIAAITHVIM